MQSKPLLFTLNLENLAIMKMYIQKGYGTSLNLDSRELLYPVRGKPWAGLQLV